jgi:hypothetical protein
MKKICIFFVIAGLLLATSPGVFAEPQTGLDTTLHAQEVDGFVVAIDVLLVRPLSVVALAGGAILFVPAWLFQTIGGNDITPVREALIEKPYWFLMQRPVGRF